MRTPLVLLPPSEGKAEGGDGPPWAESRHAFSSLDPQRREVISALRAAMHGDEQVVATLLGVGPAAARPAMRANLAIDSAPTLPAIERYTGVLFDALGYRELPARLRRRVDAQVVILSAVWGAVAPRDPIPDYKLKMGASLPGLGRLSSAWRPTLSPLLDDRAAGRVVWDLLPNEHAAAWKPGGGAVAHIRVRFLDEVARGGERRLVTVSHWNKLLKGALVRHVLDGQLREPDGLATFTHPQGYVYRPELTVVGDRGVEVSLVATRP
jgi:cytoplasmic iron level regulating protein YaaA (DUF328/UPF0246 family)